MKFKPLGNKVIIQPDPVPSEVKTKGGLIIPNEVMERKRMSIETGTVISVGPGIRNQDGEYVPLVVKEGDKIAYNHLAVFMSKLLNENGEEDFFLYISENDIIAIIEK